MYAVRAGCYSCVEQLVAAGADINFPTPEGITPLMLALDNSHNEVAKFLMDKGAYLDVWDWWGRTPLWIAVDRKPPAGGGAAVPAEVSAAVRELAEEGVAVAVLQAAGVDPAETAARPAVRRLPRRMSPRLFPAWRSLMRCWMPVSIRIRR